MFWLMIINVAWLIVTVKAIVYWEEPYSGYFSEVYKGEGLQRIIL